jgi:lipopolysaccharide heptosyltransferase I
VAEPEADMPGAMDAIIPAYFRMRILIVKLSSIGDVVHTLPAAAYIRRALPDARISWAVERQSSEILKRSPTIDRLIELDMRSWRKDPISRNTRAEVKSAIAALRSATGDMDRFDIAIDFQGLIKSGLVAYVAGAKKRVGFETSDLREKGSRIFLTDQVKTSDIEHVIEKNLAVARKAIAGRAVDDSAINSRGRYEFPIQVSDDDEEYVEKATRAVEGDFAIINPGGGWPTKLWPAESFGELADWLYKEYRLASFVTYGPGEEPLAERVARSSRTRSARVLPSTIKQFVALARRARIFIGGDTGPLHIAAACGAPVVGIYGPTSPARNGPFENDDIAVGRDLWCRTSCHRRKCWHWECMDIPLAAVSSGVAARLARALKPELINLK